MHDAPLIYLVVARGCFKVNRFAYKWGLPSNTLNLIIRVMETVRCPGWYAILIPIELANVVLLWSCREVLNPRIPTTGTVPPPARPLVPRLFAFLVSLGSLGIVLNLNGARVLPAGLQGDPQQRSMGDPGVDERLHVARGHALRDSAPELAGQTNILSSATRWSSSFMATSMGAGDDMSTPAAFRMSRGYAEPPAFRKPR
jgi:hypothetical protein